MTLNDDKGMTDKSPGWEDRHPNPSGLTDDKKVPQPVPAEHHEDGHEDLA